MRYKSKPATCEAEQLILSEDRAPLAKGVESDERGYYVVTAHGQRTLVVDGDFIVTEPDGRGYYPVKPDIFEKRWEPV
jgi:hypothetical protein